MKNSVKEIAEWKERGEGVGDYGDFLGLSDAERAEVELELAVVRAVRKARSDSGITQKELAKRIGSSQPRVAAIEAGASGVTLGLAFKALFALGGTMANVMLELEESAKRNSELRSRLDQADAIVKKRAKVVDGAPARRKAAARK